MPTIVPIYAAILGIIFAALSLRAANTRRTMQIGIGSGGDRTLERRVRVHGNFAEYVPFALILLAFTEMQGSPKWLLHALCVVLVLARLSHCYGVAQVKEVAHWRVLGFFPTVAIILIAAIQLLLGAMMRTG